jgi:ribosomal protein L7/L12
VIAVGLFIHTFSRYDDRRLVARLAEVERKLDAIAEHLGVDPQTPDMPDVVEFLRQGQKIQAIKVYRERTGTSLKEAKDACDRMALELGL